MATVRPCAGPLREELADELLAAAVAVHVGGVDERHAGVDRRLQGRERVVLADLAPVGAELPGAQPDHADVPAQSGEKLRFSTSEDPTVAPAGTC